MAVTTFHVMADDYTYLSIVKSDGGKSLITAVGTTITFTDGMLQATNGDEELELTITDLAKMYFTNEAATLLGDVNEDGLINLSDVTCAINYILGRSVTTFNFLNADMNSDGLINVSDVTAIINVILRS